MKTLKHDHIVQLIDCQQTREYIHLIMDYCGLGDLSQFIKRRNRFNDYYPPDLARTLERYPPGPGGGLNEYLVKYFLRQLASAVRFLRSKNLIHRDLKPQNLLLVPGPTSSSLPILKVADFGFSRYLPKTSLAETLCGSPLYMAPEILRCHQYGAEVDLWSIGTVLYETLVGKPPFRAQNHIDLLVKIDKGEDRIKFPGEKEGVGGVSERLKELCRALLKKDPRDRMTFQSFFAHQCVVEDLTETNAPIVAEHRTIRRLSAASDRTTPPPRSPADDARGLDDFATIKGTHPMQRSPSNETQTTVPLPPQPRRISPPYDVTGPPLQPRRVSLTSQRPPLAVDTRTSPVGLPPGASPSSRYAPELERNPSLRSNSGNLATSKGSPAGSYLQQRIRPRTPEEASATVGGGAASLEVDYVLVESRRAVEVNALADELAYLPHQRLADATKPRYGDALIKRGTSYAIGNTGTSPIATTAQIRNNPRGGLTSDQRSVSAPTYPHVPGSQSPSPTGGQGYIPSERRFGTSPSSKLAKAISMASMKLFGASNASPPYVPSHDRTAVMKATSAIAPEEEAALREIEDIAQRSHVIFQFAEMKLFQVIPLSSSSGNPPSSPSSRRNSWKNSILTDEADATLCQEALSLYVKSLTLLQKSMDLAARYWQRRGGTGVASARLNNAVQLGRERFNETLEKADFAKSKIPPALVGINSPAPEKLIYDRALEMVCNSPLRIFILIWQSRVAAVNELVGDDLPQCESSYETSIIMLEALLEPLPTDGINDGEATDKLDEEDRLTIEKCILSLSPPSSNN